MSRSSVERKQRSAAKIAGRTWGEWRSVAVTDDMKLAFPHREYCTNIFANNRYQVEVFPFPCPGIGGIQQLCVSRHYDLEEISWDELQRIVHELFGESVTAVEIFPARHVEWKIQSKVRVLWVLPTTYTLPFGLHFVEAWGGLATEEN